MKTLSGLLLLLLITCAGFIYWAQSPAVNGDAWTAEAIKDFSNLDVWGTPDNPTELKVATYNMGYASGQKNNQPIALNKAEVKENLDMMILELRDLNPDVLCLQEVDFQAARTFNYDQMTYLVHGLHLPYVAYVTTWNKNYLPWPYWPVSAHFGKILSGQVILSRYPITQQTTKHFTKPVENDFWYNWFYLDRIAQEATIQVGKRTISIWNVHFEAFKTPARMRQIQELVAHIQQQQVSPHIIAGDFNSPPEAEGTRLAITKLKLKDSSQNPHEKSIPSWKPVKKIDHILYKDLQLKQGGVITGLEASDHLPVWAEFKL